MHGGVGGGGREANPYPDKHPGSGIGSASRDFERAPQRRNIEVSTRHGQIECDEPSRSDAIRPPADRGWKQGTAWKLPLGATCERWPRRAVCSSESIGPIPGLELTGQARFPRLARLARRGLATRRPRAACPDRGGAGPVPRSLSRCISLQLAIGVLLLLFGMRWLRKAILRSAGSFRCAMKLSPSPPKRRNCVSELAGTRRGSIGSRRLPVSRRYCSKASRSCSS